MTKTSDTDRPTGPVVFISYAHEDEPHTAAVLNLATFLQRRGITMELDHWHNDGRRDWYTWAIRAIQSADFVLVVASPRYRAVGDGSAPGDEHRGVQAETAVLRDLLYRDRPTWLGRVLPVVLPGRSLDELPTFTQPYSASHFVIDAITDDGVDGLLRVLTRQPRFVPPPRGQVPTLPRTTAAAPTADRAAARRVLDTLGGLVGKVAAPRLEWRAGLVSLTVALLVGLLVALPHGWDQVLDGTADDSQLAPPADSAAAPESSAGNSPRTTNPAGTTKSGQGHGQSTSGSGGPGYSGTGPDGAVDEQRPVSGGRSGSRGGTIEILAVGHTFTADTDRITATIRNTRADPVLVNQIRIYMRRPHGGWHSDDTWHFTMPGDMQPGDPGEDGSRRTQGLITISGSEFRTPLIGQGYVEEQDSFKRLLTFEPQKFLAGSATANIVIDIPNTMLLQSTSPQQPAGPMVEHEFKPQQGSLFTYFEMQTPEDLTYACDYLRQREDDSACGKVDPLAEVSLPH